ncbi:MAG: iron ABC transporter permease [Planctomycetota bacterium]
MDSQQDRHGQFQRTRRRRRFAVLWSSVALLCVVLLFAVSTGSVTITWKQVGSLVWQRLAGGTTPDDLRSASTILFDLRLPRVLSMALTGASLALAGAAYQGLFRNPLADPYVIGVASGAGLGATAVLSFLPAEGNLFWVPAGAFVGGVVSVCLVLAIARQGGALPSLSLVLSGVAVGALTSSLTTFWMLESPDGMRRAFSWILGGYTAGGWAPVVAVLPPLAISALVLQASSHSLNVFQLGEDAAGGLGVRVRALRFLVVGAATLATAAAVSFGGLIGFVGLIVPHAARLLVGVDYRWILPLSLVAGASLLVSADLAARTVLAPREIPVAIVTSLLGAPFFLYLLKRRNRRDAI